MNITTATPAEIDAEIARIGAEAATATAAVERGIEILHTLIGDKRIETSPRTRWSSAVTEWEMTPEQVIAATVAGPAAEWNRSSFNRALNIVIDASRASNAARAALAPLYAEFTRRGGWTRAYLVQNNGGHVHSTTACRTCFVTTKFGWLTQVSGMTEAEIVDLAGEGACSECYPTAPRIGANRLELPEVAAVNAERAAAKAARDAAKAAKAITNPDGSVLRTEREPIRTVATAWMTLVDNVFNHRAYGYSAKPETNDRIIAALAAKLGQTEDEVRATVEVKVTAKAKREKVTLAG